MGMCGKYITHSALDLTNENPGERKCSRSDHVSCVGDAFVTFNINEYDKLGYIKPEKLKYMT